MSQVEKKKYFVDLFAGCGGLSLGLEQAGFHPMLVCELADEARQTYLVNRQGTNFEHFNKCRIDQTSEPKWCYDEPSRPWVWKDAKALRRYIESDLKSFRAKVSDQFGVRLGYKELDLLVGGPPCQGFSGIGHRRSYAVDKEHIPSNYLYEDMIYLIEALKPKMFLFENVRGLTWAKWKNGGNASSKGEIWKHIRKEFREILGDEYHIGWHLVKASEYGVPQNRPRVLLVGARKCLKWKPVLGGQDEIGLLHKGPKRAGGLLPEQIEDLAPPSLWELLSDLVEEPHTNGGETEVYPQSAGSEISKRLRTWPGEGKHRAKGKPVSDHKYSKHSDRIERKFKKMIEHGKLPDDKEHERLATKKFAQRVLPKDWGDNGPTITATSLPDDYVHFSQPRILTVREWARLQLFPDWYKFEGKRTTGGIRRAGNPRDEVFDREVPKYTQIGNAVPVGLAEQIGLRFKDILDGKG